MVFLADDHRQVVDDLNEVATISVDVAERLARHIGVSPTALSPQLSPQLFPWPDEAEADHMVTCKVVVKTFGKKSKVQRQVLETLEREAGLAFGAVEVTSWDE